MNLSRFSLEGKLALITGATTGIGQALSIALASAGADICGVATSGNFNETKNQVEKWGKRFHGITANLLRNESVDYVIEETCSHFGKINILINNAGICRRAPIFEFSHDDWYDVMELNINIIFFLSQGIARVFEKQGTGGKIINICSVLSFQGGLYVPSYTASKSALLGLTRSMANELASKGINVNAIVPGYIVTRANKKLRDDAVRSHRISERIPAGRWGKPEDLGGMAIFLASSASDYCHGGAYPVDGGWLAW